MRPPLLALSLILAATAAHAEPAGPRGTSQCPSLEIGSSTVRVFSAARETDIALHARFKNAVKDTHLLELKLYTPRGKLYQVMAVPFTAVKTRPGATVKVDGFPRPLALTQGTPGPKGLTVSTRLPVAGTWIVSNSLFGGWRVDAHMDGAKRACSSERFTIAQ